MKLYNRAKRSIASGVQTYSKQPCRFVEGVYPEYVSHGQGPYLYADGKRYIDFMCGLGTNVLGYADPLVNETVIRQLGHGTLFSLPNTLEIDLAEQVKRMVPSIELLRFLKSGSEAVSAGIKIARAYTGRDIVLSSGYHGWHDWSTPITKNNAGTPSILGDSIFDIRYNHIEDLEEMFKLYPEKVACVVIDPIVFEEPKDGYLSKLVKISHKHGALVLFDEVVTGIRWERFAVQNAYGVKPDLTALGKAMANGFPMACIGGRKDVMRVLDGDCFVSSTYGGDLVGISAAIATLDIIEGDNVPHMLKASGEYFMDGINSLSDNYGLDTYVDGTPFRQRLNCPTPEHKALLWQECVRRGVMLGGAQHTSYSHRSEVIEEALNIVSDAMQVCKDHWHRPKSALKGKMPQQVATISSLRT